MYTKIPMILKTESAWVCVDDDSKIPFQAVGNRYASASDPETWSSFSMVCAAPYNHIGYVFHNTNLIGIDIDKGFNPDGTMTDLATDIISKCKSYTEISRSGRGVHILLYGTLPFTGKNNRDGVEIYNNNRYFIMTGNAISDSEIIENQDAVDYILATYFKDVPKESKDYMGECLYKPIKTLCKGRIVTVYPDIPQGMRNVSLLSYGGQLRKMECSKDEIIRELKKVNSVACNPPLEDDEVLSIVRSVMKYK